MLDATWPMMRGHVWKIWFDPDDESKSAPINKYVVIVQGQDFFQRKTRVSAVLATSQPEPRNYPWEVRVPAGSVVFWPIHTRICCGDIWSFRVEEIQRRARRPVGVLPPEIMREVEVALSISLGLARSTPVGPVPRRGTPNSG